MMAYYEYKRVRDLLPAEYQTNEQIWKICCGEKCKNEKHPCTYDGDANYDGDMWTVTACYIEDLQSQTAAAYERGQRDMRERAAKSVDGAWGDIGDTAAVEIRALPLLPMEGK